MYEALSYSPDLPVISADWTLVSLRVFWLERIGTNLSLKLLVSAALRGALVSKGLGRT